MDFMDKARRCQEFIEALDEERRKIEVFRRELPLCLRLIDQTMESYKKLMVDDVHDDEKSTLLDDHEPVMKEFLSLRPNLMSCCEKNCGNEETLGRKLDWMKSTQLWTNDIANQTSKINDLEKSSYISCNKRNLGSDTEEQNIIETEALGYDLNTEAEDVSTDNDRNDISDEEEKKDNVHLRRKVRRCWSEELHNRFLHALEQLGGCHVATPKQIRELMQVDGLTNDEVKSHLQKYRLHTRRRNSIYGNTPTPHFVVVGSIVIPATGSHGANEHHHIQRVITNSNTNGVVKAPLFSLPSNMLMFQDKNHTEIINKNIHHI